MARTHARRSVIIAVLVGCGLGAAAPAVFAVCEVPRVKLAGGATVVGRQTEVVWAPVDGATAYRVRLQSRVPNGRVVASHDTTVSAPVFRAPQPLAEQRAKVTVRLTALCGDETSTESVSWFLIDTSAACRLAEVAARSEGGRTRLEWKALEGARAYDVRAHALADGRQLAAREARTASVELKLKEPAVLSVRPLCASGEGEAVYRVVAAD